MSNSVTLSIATNSAIAASKAFGFFVTGSPTLFAETVHSIADVGNQLLLKLGEVRARPGPDREHPFGRGQEKFFWALVSAVSVFFVGCGINLYHGVHALVASEPVQPFSLLVLGLLLFAFCLEAWTFSVAWREIGGLPGLSRNRHNTTVLAVLMEDSVALIGILLTLLVGGISWFFGPRPMFDALVAIVVGLLLGAMAIFLAGLNRKLLIDTSDADVDHATEVWLAEHNIAAQVRSLVLSTHHAIVFIRAHDEVQGTRALGDTLIEHLARDHGKKIETVYWQFGAAD